MLVFFEGMLYGLIFLLALGPAFFALFHTALSHGFTKAMAVSLGTNMTDSAWIALVIIGLGSFLNKPELSTWFGAGGAVMLLIFGISTWFSKSELPPKGQVKDGNLLRFWLKGVALNGLNPLIPVFWVGVVGSVTTLGYQKTEQFWFFAGFISTVLTLDMMKALFISKLSRFITPKRMQILNRIVAIVFVGFSVRLIVYVFYG